MRVLVLGAAVSGLAAARLARRLGHAVSVYDRDPATAPALLASGFGVVTGAWSRDLLDGIDLVVASPGFPERSLPVTETLERGLPLWSEIEFAWRRLDRPTVAITGTNGKTTTTSLTADMLAASGIDARALGNIGDPLSGAIDDPPAVAVVEVSSFQLRFTEAFRPDVAVVVNVAPDHLDWHGSFAAYLAAKQMIVARQRPDDLCIYDADDEGASRVAARAPGRRQAVSVAGVPAGGAGIADGRLYWPGLRLPLDRLRVADPAFLADVLLAGAAALAAGASVEGVAEVAVRFSPGKHRRTVVGEWAGVTYVDDSKATNPHAAVAAIRAYPSVVLIAGGLAKGLEVGPLAEQPNVRCVVAIGESAPVLLGAAGDRGIAAGSMEEAVRIAASVARPGDVVLLAPGCASFDMFSSYAARGDAFAAAVSTIMEARS
jgi:UDP-N-acetylmuramoylalanine--D-glutamate ligase